MSNMDIKLIGAKKIEMKEFIMETLELEEFPRDWERSLGFVYIFLNKAIKVEVGKEVADKEKRNKILIKLVEDSIFGCDNEFLLEDYEYYLNTQNDGYIFIDAREKLRDDIIRRHDKYIVGMIESGEI